MRDDDDELTDIDCFILCVGVDDSTLLTFSFEASGACLFLVLDDFSQRHTHVETSVSKERLKINI